MVFVVALAVAVGAFVAPTRTGPVGRWLKSKRLTAGSAFVFVAGAVLVGGLSHLFADTLSAPDIAQPLEPFRPFFEKPWSIDVIYDDSSWWNVGLLTVAVLLHLVIAFATEPLEHRYRIA
ncbi:MAG: inner membrane protein [Halobacteriales archaeon]